MQVQKMALKRRFQGKDVAQELILNFGSDAYISDVDNRFPQSDSTLKKLVRQTQAAETGQILDNLDLLHTWCTSLQ
jgi:hypothetical protein